MVRVNGMALASIRAHRLEYVGDIGRAEGDRLVALGATSRLAADQLDALPEARRTSQPAAAARPEAGEQEHLTGGDQAEPCPPSRPRPGSPGSAQNG